MHKSKKKLHKETPFITYAEGRMQQNIGDALLRQKDKLTAPIQIREKVSEVQKAYTKALELWQKPASSPTDFGLSDGEISSVEKKAVRCAEMLDRGNFKS